MVVKKGRVSSIQTAGIVTNLSALRGFQVKRCAYGRNSSTVSLRLQIHSISNTRGAGMNLGHLPSVLAEHILRYPGGGRQVGNPGGLQLVIGANGTSVQTSRQA